MTETPVSFSPLEAMIYLETKTEKEPVHIVYDTLNEDLKDLMRKEKELTEASLTILQTINIWRKCQDSSLSNFADRLKMFFFNITLEVTVDPDTEVCHHPLFSNNRHRAGTKGWIISDLNEERTQKIKFHYWGINLNSNNILYQVSSTFEVIAMKLDMFIEYMKTHPQPLEIP